MSEKPKSSRQAVRIHQHLIPQIERYAEENNVSFSRAANEMIAAFDKGEKKDPKQQLATKEDVARILKRIELTNMILEPALLELLEASGSSRFEAHEDEDKLELGRAIKAKYRDLFKDIREIL